MYTVTARSSPRRQKSVGGLSASNSTHAAESTDEPVAVRSTSALQIDAQICVMAKRTYTEADLQIGRIADGKWEGETVVHTHCVHFARRDRLTA